jgi:hypothetical protein
MYPLLQISMILYEILVLYLPHYHEYMLAHKYYVE